MRRYDYPYYGKRYLVNTNTVEIHDLDNEQSGCKINQIRVEHVKMFDTLDEAKDYQRRTFGYVNGCAYCLPHLHTR